MLSLMWNRDDNCVRDPCEELTGGGAWGRENIPCHGRMLNLECSWLCSFVVFFRANDLFLSHQKQS